MLESSCEKYSREYRLASTISLSSDIVDEVVALREENTCLHEQVADLQQQLLVARGKSDAFKAEAQTMRRQASVHLKIYNDS